MRLEPPAPAIQVMLVDDHEHVLWGLRRLVNGEYPRMHVVGVARTVAEMVVTIRQWRPEVLVLSDRLAGECAISQLPRILGSWPASILVLMGLRDPYREAQALRNGADEILLKGCPAEQLLGVIERLQRCAPVQ